MTTPSKQFLLCPWNFHPLSLVNTKHHVLPTPRCSPFHYVICSTKRYSVPNIFMWSLIALYANFKTFGKLFESHNFSMYMKIIKYYIHVYEYFVTKRYQPNFWILISFKMIWIIFKHCWYLVKFDMLFLYFDWWNSDNRILVTNQFPRTFGKIAKLYHSFCFFSRCPSHSYLISLAKNYTFQSSQFGSFFESAVQ